MKGIEVIVLAGGLGTRLRGEVDELPKCMAPISENEDGHHNPFLKYLLDYLSEFNVGHVILSVGYKKECILKWIDHHRDNYDFEIDFAAEPEPLGTGGALKLALTYVQGSKAVIINGDTLFNINLDEFYKTGISYDYPLFIAMKQMRSFDRYGNVSYIPVDADKNDSNCRFRDKKSRRKAGRVVSVTKFQEKKFCKRGCINGGIYILDKEQINMDDYPEIFSFEKEILEPMAQTTSPMPSGISSKETIQYVRSNVGGMIFKNYFIDIGIPEDYFRAQRELPERQICVNITRELLHNDKYADLNVLLLDRDGVINRLLPGDYVKNKKEFVFMPGVLRAISMLSKKFTRIFVITNQRGVGKGIMTRDALLDIHQSMTKQIVSTGGRIDKIYACSAVEDNNHYRKPSTGMFEKLLQDFPEVKPEKCIMLGDSDSDMQFAQNCGVQFINVNKYSSS